MCSHVISSRIFALFGPFLLTLLILLSACEASSNPTSSTNPAPTSSPKLLTTDFYGTPIAFPGTAPQKIVSLIPSTSEILDALHLDSKVVGVDYYTNYPKSLTTLPKVSDATSKYNVEQIVALKPDLVLSDGGETKQYDSQLKNLGLHVVDLPSANLEQILEQISTIGKLTFAEAAANTLVQQLQQQIDAVKKAVAGTTAPKVMIELDDSTPGKPYVFGGSSFGDELLQDANAQNIFHNNTSGLGYPQVSDEAVISANPQFIILTEPAQYGGDPSAVYKRPNWNAIEAVQMRHVSNLSGDIVTRPGPRIVEGLQCIAQIVHPDKFSSPLPAYCTASS